MGWFKKTEKVPDIPAAPAIPAFPEKIEDSRRELPELPSFPNNSKNESINREMVKSAVSDNYPPEEDDEVMPEFPAIPAGIQSNNQSLIPPRPHEIPEEYQGIPEPPKQPSLIKKPEVIEKTIKEKYTPEPLELSYEIPRQPQEQIPAIPTIARNPPTPAPIHPIQEQPIAIPKQTTEELKPVGPIFVRIDKFQAAQKNFDSIKEKVKEIESLLKKINDVKSREEDELNAWSKEVEGLKAKLSEIDSEIFDQL